MSLERIFKALIDLGLSDTETQIYIFLATKGPKKVREVATALRINRQQVYRIIKRLRNRSIIAVNGYPAEFTAIPFEEVLNLLIQCRKKSAKTAQNSKKVLLSNWQTLMKKNNREKGYAREGGARAYSNLSKKSEGGETSEEEILQYQ